MSVGLAPTSSQILSQHSAISKVACQTDAIGSVAKISSSTTLTYTMTVLAELHGTYHENREHTFGRFFDVLICSVLTPPRPLRDRPPQR